jgi:ADP-ribose pyrophosphatase
MSRACNRQPTDLRRQDRPLSGGHGGASGRRHCQAGDHRDRSAIADFLLELPAGTLEPGEAPEVAAPRELAEETGDHASHWRLLTSIHTTPGICDETLHIFLATGLTPGPSSPDADEYIEVVTLPLDRALAMVRSGQISDAKTIAGLLLTAVHL